MATPQHPAQDSPVSFDMNKLMEAGMGLVQGDHDQLPAALHQLGHLATDRFSRMSGTEKVISLSIASLAVFFLSKSLHRLQERNQ